MAVRSRFEIPLWKDVPDSDWSSYEWQMQHRLKTLAELEQVLALSPSERRAVEQPADRFLMQIPPYWAALMDADDPNCPIRRQAVPVDDELFTAPTDLIDPLAEDRHMPVPGLVHQYPDRVLLLVIEYCAMYCRFCTRSRVVGTTAGYSRQANVDRALDYIRAHPEVRDVLISGGDPLSLSDERLDAVLDRVRAIPHVEFLRIGTRTPVTLPFRVTESLCGVLRTHAPVWMSLHFNHPREVTPEAERACAMLADSGVPLGSQTVLLKGINDDPATMKALVHRLLRNRVRPYYIYQCDPVRGTSHFRTPPSAGVRIIENLRGHTSGYAVPTFVVDAPGGGGKVPVGPQYVVAEEPDRLVVRNYAGELYEYKFEADRDVQEQASRVIPASAVTIGTTTGQRAPAPV
ncbi:MAG: KamA family radical SAM protein [Vicinamibacterales bacterium]